MGPGTARRARGLRSWHLALAGFVAQCGFAAYAWLGSPPATPLDAVTHAFAVLLLVGLGLAGLVPAGLLARPATHRAGRHGALGLGVAGVLSLFWALQGVLLLAAFAWATWREMGDGAVAPPSARPPG